MVVAPVDIVPVLPSMDAGRPAAVVAQFNYRPQWFMRVAAVSTRPADVAINARRSLLMLTTKLKFVTN